MILSKVGLYPSASNHTEIPETEEVIRRMMQHRRNRLETFR
jgi:hypothetical protein